MAYIDKNQVINRLRQLGEIASEPPMDDKDKYNLELIHRLESEFSHHPIADVVEIKHGKWESRGFHGHNCSVCDALNDIDTKYCPNCGAKMDGGKAE